MSRTTDEPVIVGEGDFRFEVAAESASIDSVLSEE